MKVRGILMFSEYYLLLLLYPFSYIVYKGLKLFNVPDKPIFYGFIIGFFLCFYSLFSSYIVGRVENTYLAITGLIYFMAFVEDRISLSNLFKYFTSFWISLVSVWSFVGYVDSIIVLGLVILLCTKESRGSSMSKVLLWLFAIVITLITGELGVIQGQLIRNWFIEIIFFLIFVMTLPIGRNSNSGGLSQYLLSLGVIHLALAHYGQLPYGFSRILIGFQILFLVSYASKNDGRSLITSLLCSAIILMPSQGVSSVLQVSLFAYTCTFIVLRHLKYGRSMLASLLNFVMILFIAHQVFSLKALGIQEVLTSALIIIAILVDIYKNNNFNIRQRQASLISS